MSRKPPRPGRGANDDNRLSGHRAVYSKTTGGLTRSIYRCQCHGREFETRTILAMHVKAYRNMIRTSLSEMVKTGNLGQPAWERLPGETPLQFRRFMIYLQTANATGQRSADRASRTMGISENAARILASKWQWALRAELWDRHVESEEFRQFEVEKRTSARRQARLGQKLQQVAMAAASCLLQDADRIAEMSGNEIAKLTDIGTKVERLANSDPTAISEDRGQVKLVWEGPRPEWAPTERQVGSGSTAPKTIEAGGTNA